MLNINEPLECQHNIDVLNQVESDKVGQSSRAVIFADSAG